MDNIVLCGFMGCGKTTVGRNLARKSGRKFVDMDSYIEEKAGMKVSEIFERYGENVSEIWSTRLVWSLQIQKDL